MSVSHSASRAGMLTKLFWSINNGENTVSSSNAGRYIEACNLICKQKSPGPFVEKLISSPASLDALKQALWSQKSPAFITHHALPFLKNLTDPGVVRLSGGNFLQKVIVAILVPATWDAVLDVRASGKLDDLGLEVFAWLCLQVVSSQLSELGEHTKAVRELVKKNKFPKAHSPVQEIVNQIRRVLRVRKTYHPTHGNGPGGRHDNDFSDFRQISIYPTAQEFLSTEEPYLPRLDDIFNFPVEARAAANLDRNFRLLREDLIAGLREGLQIAMNRKKGKRTPVALGDLRFFGVDVGNSNRRTSSVILLECGSGIGFPSNLPQGRKTYLEDTPKFLKHESFGSLCLDGTILAFGSLIRDLDNLVKQPPVVGIRFADQVGLKKAMAALVGPERGRLQFVIVETTIFAYEPILKQLQTLTQLPLEKSLIDPKEAPQTYKQPDGLTSFVKRLEKAYESGSEVTLPPKLFNNKVIRLHGAQLLSLINGLKREVGQIQGPPGTGKSFLGALIILIILHFTDFQVLILTYTNHALDQFIGDLLEMGVDSTDIVRLGSKSTPATECTRLENHVKEGGFCISHEQRRIIKNYKEDQDESFQNLTALSEQLNSNIPYSEILQYLEFLDKEPHFYAAFQVPQDGDGYRRMKHLTEDQLYSSWLSGSRTRMLVNFIEDLDDAARHLWEIPVERRRQYHENWEAKVRENHASEMLVDNCQKFNQLQSEIDSIFNENKRQVVQAKRITACTTSVAGSPTSIIKAANPEVVIVEEAGEIVEAHVIAALNPSVKHLILIGDHKQLRPKVNSYNLSIETGQGYNLDVSLFERLINQGHHYTTLEEQHRCHPDISHLTRMLSYPELKDAPVTANREVVRGLPTRVIFAHHEQPEEELTEIEERRDPSAKGTKKNRFEAQMVLKMVKYLRQQGYETENMVVLTPYLGQLSLLRTTLRAENDPVLNELDSRDLLRAGFSLESRAARAEKSPPLRLSTIDNYQGEESDIVIASLTRSNESGDIGFLRARERLVVLVSRARNGIVLFGNMETFKKSKIGGDMWSQFFEALEERKSLFVGVPVVCERHPERRATLTKPADFDQRCPEGGCSEPCGVALQCGKHFCKRRCHRIVDDHSKIPCKEKGEWLCIRGHRLIVVCGDQSAVCEACAREDEENRRRMQRELAMKIERQRKEEEEKRRRVQRDLKMEAERKRKEDEYKRELEARAREHRQRQKNQEFEIQELEMERQHQQKILDFETKELESVRQHQKKVFDIQSQGLEAVSNYQQQLLKSESEFNKQVAALEQKRMDIENLDEKISRRKELKAQSSRNGPAGESSSRNDPGIKTGPSPARDQWDSMKRSQGARNAAMDDLMKMIGLESVKCHFLDVKTNIDTKIRQGVSLVGERFGCSLLGNPGTGKTTVARLWAKLLTTVGAIPGGAFEETTGSKLANAGVNGCQKILEKIKNDGGGVLFIDEAYQLSSGTNPGGKAVLDYLLGEVENLQGKVAFVIAGYSKEMEAFFAHNSGLPSRFPIEMKFEDYSDEELLKILQLKLHNKYNGKMKVENGLDGLFLRITSRRIGSGRGTEGFGNARAVENALGVIERRQAKRLSLEQQAGQRADDFFMTKEDIIGPVPSEALTKSKAYQKLNELVGLAKVKENLGVLVDTLQTNYDRELDEQPLVKFSLNRVFLGPPGTGKTTVAKLYGEVLVDLGLLSNGEVAMKNPADFVGSALGQSEALTKGILATTVGKVLVIDEAYGLYGGGDGQNTSDPYKTAVVDTIVAEVHSVPGDNRCVLLLGYTEQMEEMFQKVNPGLARRFPISSAFIFEDFNDDELSKILDFKLKASGFKVTAEAKRVALEVLRRARNRPNFGNAGEVDILLGRAKESYQKRGSAGKGKRRALLEAVDFDSEFERAEKSGANIRELFRGDVGREDLIERLEVYQKRVRCLKDLDMDPEIPFNFLFRGPPGTGKTTTARKMGKVYYDMGFLTDNKVIECSASDMIAQYVGQTGPKVRQLLDRALGRVLFIDEAYRLAGEGFAKEAVDELVDSVTKPKYQGKMIIILAGYEKDINTLLAINCGMSSRFPEVVDFHTMAPSVCIKLIADQLEIKKSHLARKKRVLDISCVQSPRQPFLGQLERSFEALSAQEGWANARDVIHLAKCIFGGVDMSSNPIRLTEEIVNEQIDKLFREREDRMTKKNYHVKPHLPAAQRQPPAISTKINTATAPPQAAAEYDEDTEIHSSSDGEAPRRGAHVGIRDAGVSDEVWEQLQRDKAEEDRRENEYQERKRKAEIAMREQAEEERREQERRAESLRREKAEKDRRERQRIAQQERERRAQMEQKRKALEEAKRQLMAEEKRRLEEEARRQKLERSGLCPAGFAWTKQAGGYRCAGGSHWVADTDLQNF